MGRRHPRCCEAEACKRASARGARSKHRVDPGRVPHIWEGPISGRPFDCAPGGFSRAEKWTMGREHPVCLQVSRLSPGFPIEAPSRTPACASHMGRPHFRSPFRLRSGRLLSRLEMDHGSGTSRLSPGFPGFLHKRAPSTLLTGLDKPTILESLFTCYRRPFVPEGRSVSPAFRQTVFDWQHLRREDANLSYRSAPRKFASSRRALR